MDDVKINYKLLLEAINYYEKHGFKYLEMPWLISPDISSITKPDSCKHFYINDKVLVASGEQSFLQEIANNNLGPGRYCCLTPCFRDEKNLSKTHRQYFMKVELIEVRRSIEDPLNDYQQDSLDDMINLCWLFLSSYVKCDIIKTDIGYDIISHNGLELGSYGIREHPKVGQWIYATGCAEPRTSLAIASN